MGTEVKQIGGFGDWVSDVERKARAQERRKVPQVASDLLGPGFGPRCIQTTDWNSEECTFNGMFWSPIGAINSPDSEIEWMGITLGQLETYHGVQHIWAMDDSDPPREYVRTWKSVDGGVTHFYGEWRGDSEWMTAAMVLPQGGSTITSQNVKTTRTTVAVRAVLTLGSVIAVNSDGNVINTTLARMAADLRPTSMTSGVQGLGQGGGGSNSSWYIDGDGFIVLSAVAPGSVLGIGDSISFAGTYLL